MQDFSYMQIYFAVASVATIAVFGLLLAALFYILGILRDIKKLSSLARREAEFIARSVAKGAGIFGAELSEGAASFVKTLFALLISHTLKPKARRTRKIPSI